VGFNLNSIWLTLLMLNLAVIIHEYGHLITARAFGVTVYEFSVGMGPLIGKFTRRGVQYSLRWILIGGFCKIAGMDMALEGETKDPETRADHMFYNLALWKKIIVLATGAIFNLALGMVIWCFAMMVIGTPVISKGALAIDSIVIGSVNPKSPAMKAGIQPGDKIITVNDQHLNNLTDLSNLVQQSATKVLRIKVARKDQILVKGLIPQYSPENKKYLIGVILMPIPKFKKTSIIQATKDTITFPWNYLKLLGQVLSGKIKGGLSGPVGIVSVVDQALQSPPQLIIINIVQLFFIISISLCFFNLLPLPLPILDGGWIVILIIEKILRREFSTEQKTTAYTIGLVLFLLTFVWVTYGDIISLVKRVIGG
jgi:regulator of sigma E protease